MITEKLTKNYYIHFLCKERNYYGIKYSYYQQNYVQDKAVKIIGTLFTDQGLIGLEWIERHLLNSNSHGISGELARIDINDNKVIVEPTEIWSDDPEEEAIEMDRQELLKLVHKWQELVNRKSPHIYIFWQNGQLDISGTLPLGID